MVLRLRQHNIGYTAVSLKHCGNRHVTLQVCKLQLKCGLPDSLSEVEYQLSWSQLATTDVRDHNVNVRPCTQLVYSIMMFDHHRQCSHD